MGSLDAVVREHLVKTLREHGGHQLKASDQLGISRWTLFRKIKKLNIKREEYECRSSLTSRA